MNGQSTEPEQGKRSLPAIVGAELVPACVCRLAASIESGSLIVGGARAGRTWAAQIASAVPHDAPVVTIEAHRPTFRLCIPKREPRITGDTRRRKKRLRKKLAKRDARVYGPVIREWQEKLKKEIVRRMIEGPNTGFERREDK